jgi:hypothetical protein
MRDWEIARLTAEVEAVNMANAMCNRIRPVLIAYFRKLIGTKIRKMDRSFIKKVEESLPKLPEDRNITIRPELAYGNSLYWHVSARAFWSYEGELKSVEHSQSVFIGTTTDVGELVGVGDEQPLLKDDHKIDEVVRLIEAAKKAEGMASSAKSATGPFSRYV